MKPFTPTLADVEAARALNTPMLVEYRQALKNATTSAIIVQMVGLDKSLVEALVSEPAEVITAVAVALADELDARIPPRTS